MIAGEVDTPAGGTATYEDGAFALGNIVLADHGRRVPTETLGPVPADARPDFRLAAGPLTQVPLRLVGTDELPLPFDPTDSAGAAIGFPPDLVLPDITLSDAAGPWNVRPDLVASGSARDVVVEVDDEGIGHPRFGRPDDGLPVNGTPPQPGDMIQADYRVGNGVAGNVGAGAIRTLLDDGQISASLRGVLQAAGASIANPLPARGGTEPETIEQVRQRAPFAFRRQERAVTADDYARRAERFGLPGPPRVQRAVATIRWTGSWHAVVVAVDPAGGVQPDDTFLAELAGYLERYRMAGHDLEVVAAQYAPLEVGLAVQVEPSQRRDLVRAELLEVMSDRRLPDGRLGLFHPDRLTFGTSVYLGPILAAAQAIPGVERVAATRFSRYRLPGTDARAEGRIEIGPREIAQLENNPSRPERGRFHLDALEGGR
jgi:hypothetical protein